MLTSELPELLVHSKVMHRAVALLLEAGVAYFALKRASSLVDSPHMFVKVKLL